MLLQPVQSTFNQNQKNPQKGFGWVIGCAESPNFDVSSREAMYGWFQEQKSCSVTGTDVADDVCHSRREKIGEANQH
jgi:hypothetical protein